MNENNLINIRPAQHADAGTITSFQLAMALETENIVLEKEITLLGVKAVFEHPERGTYYVAAISEQIVGCMLTTPEWSDWRNRQILWIQSVYIIPENRKQGIFKALYHYLLEKIASQEEIGGIRLYVDRTNLQAQSVYHQLGMNGEHYKVYEWMKQDKE